MTEMVICLYFLILVISGLFFARSKQNHQAQRERCNRAMRLYLDIVQHGGRR